MAGSHLHREHSHGIRLGSGSWKTHSATSSRRTSAPVNATLSENAVNDRFSKYCVFGCVNVFACVGRIALRGELKREHPKTQHQSKLKTLRTLSHYLIFRRASIADYRVPFGKPATCFHKPNEHYRTLKLQGNFWRGEFSAKEKHIN